ncbi:MAG: hypothetical protein ABIG84_05685 [archaeon]
MFEESISKAYGNSDFDFTLVGDYVAIRKYGSEDINMEIFRLKPQTREVTEDVTRSCTQSYSSITHELFLLKTIADHSVEKESIVYWINQISSGKGVKAKLHEFIGEDLFIVEDDGIIKPSETCSMMLKNLEEEIYGAELGGMPEEKRNKVIGSLTVGDRKIEAPSPKRISDKIRLFKEFEESKLYPFQFEESESSPSLRPLPDGCEVKKVDDSYLLSIYGVHMVEAHSGKFNLLDVGKECFNILSKHLKSDDTTLLKYLKYYGFMTPEGTTTENGRDIASLLKIYLSGRKQAPKSRGH